MSGLIEYYARRRRAQAEKKTQPPRTERREAGASGDGADAAWTNGHVTNVQPVAPPERRRRAPTRPAAADVAAEVSANGGDPGQAGLYDHAADEVANWVDAAVEGPVGGRYGESMEPAELIAEPGERAAQPAERAAEPGDRAAEPADDPPTVELRVVGAEEAAVPVEPAVEAVAPVEPVVEPVAPVEPVVEPVAPVEAGPVAADPATEVRAPEVTPAPEAPLEPAHEAAPAAAEPGPDVAPPPEPATVDEAAGPAESAPADEQRAPRAISWRSRRGRSFDQAAAKTPEVEAEPAPEASATPEPAAAPAPRPARTAKLKPATPRVRRVNRPDAVPAAERATPAGPPPPRRPRAQRPTPAPAVTAEPATTSRSDLAGRERGRLQRRARYLRHLREVQIRDLGGFVLELHRFGVWRGDLVGAKLAGAAETDRELRALEDVLSGRRSLREVREAGVGGTCRKCGAIHGSVDRFCATCGSPLEGRSPDRAKSRTARSAEPEAQRSRSRGRPTSR